MNREFSQRYFSTASIVLFALLLLATVACAGGSDDAGTAEDDAGTEVVTPTDGGDGYGADGNDNGGNGGKAATACQGNNVKIVNVTLTAPESPDGTWGIDVDKETVTIERQGRVCWEIDGLENDYTLTMKGKTAADDQFPTRSVSPPPTFINSGFANRPGTFQYDLILTHDGSEVGKLDPSIIIRPDDGG